LVIRSATKVTEEVIEAGSSGKLKIIGRAGVGYDNIDVKSASKNGIVVKYAPYGNTTAAAELALTLMLAISRNVPQAHQSLHEGTWKREEYKGAELSNKTLGILGCGRIGQKLSELVIGFNMDVIGYDPVKNPDSRIDYMPKNDVLSKSDYVSIHTGGGNVIIGKEELSIMKSSSYLINTSRGSNIDEKALYAALKNNNISGAALDVYQIEPTKEGSIFRNELLKLENVVTTSHLGASTYEAQIKTSMEIARVVTDYLFKADFSNSVNVGHTVEEEDKDTYPIFVFHKDIMGVFADINRVLADGGINIRENPSRQIGKGDVVTVYRVHQKPTKAVMKQLRNLDFVHRAI